MPFQKKLKGTICTLLFYCYLLSLVGCSVSLPISRSKPLDSDMWSLSQIISWSSEKRSNLKQIKAIARISVSSKEGKSGFDAFLVLDNNGEGRIEILGPWKTPIFYLVFNPDVLYFYNVNDSTLYFGKNIPSDIERLTGLPLYLSHLFDSLVFNLPEDLSQCSTSLLEEGDRSFMYMDCADQNIYFKARIIIHDYPVIDEITWTGDRKHDNVRIKYFDIGEQDGYALPKIVHFQWSEGYECSFSFRSLKVNQVVPADIFKPDETWFQGKVISLEDLDS